MVTPPIKQRTHEVYREAIVLSLEIIILLGGLLLLYTLLLILQQIFSCTGVILLSIGVVGLLIFDHNRNGSMVTTTIHKFKEIGEQLGYVVVCLVSKLCDQKPSGYGHDSETMNSKIVAMWTSYIAYIGVLSQVLFRYPMSMDTFFAGGLIAIAMCANHTIFFSYMSYSTEEKSVGQNLDDPTGSNDKIVADELKELKAKYDEDRQKWEDEKRDLIEELHKSKTEVAKLIKNENPYSMFGNFDWD